MATMKMVDWSYPTSDNAKSCGMYNTGCYTISTIKENDICRLFSKNGYTKLEDAINAAKKLDFEWHPIYSKAYAALI